MTGIDGRLPRAQISMVLAEAIAEMADRAHSQADEVAIGMSRVAHEVAMQLPRCLGAGEVIVRPREMIHADVTVSRCTQPVDRQPEERDARRRSRKRLRIDLSLRSEQPWHMGIAVDREPVGIRRDDRVQRPREPIQRLVRQPIDEIDVDRAQARCAAGRDDAERLLHALNAIDGLLHLRIEVLDAEARTVKSQLAQALDVRRRGEPRIELDREIQIGGTAEAEMPDDALDDPGKIRPAEEVGSTAAEVELAHLPVVVEEGRDHRDFTKQPLDVSAARAGVTRDQPIAAAVEARAGAEGHMNVERQRPRGECRIAAPRVDAVLGLAEFRPELRCGRIRRVARACYIVAKQQITIDGAGRPAESDAFHGQVTAFPAAGSVRMFADGGRYGIAGFADSNSPMIDSSWSA